MFDLDAYLRRVGVDGRPTLAELHRAHVTHIPFENLDPHRGVAVSLQPDVLSAKLVSAGRGGYCFEHNLLFKQVLEQLGARVQPMLARVRNGRAPSPAPPLTHLLLRVEYEQALWHVDVGFGHGGLLEPIPFGPGGPYEQLGWRFRVIAEGELLVLQSANPQAAPTGHRSDDSWRDLYAFRPVPAEPIDIEVNNWWVSTSPDSRFVKGLLVSARDPQGTVTTLTDTGTEPILNVLTPTGSKREPVARGQIPSLLTERFGLKLP